MIHINESIVEISLQLPEKITYADLIAGYCDNYTGNLVFFIVLFFISFVARMYLLPYSQEGFTELWKTSFLDNNMYKNLLLFIETAKNIMEVALLFSLGYFLYIGWVLGYSWLQLAGLMIMSLFIFLLFAARIIKKIKEYKDGKSHK